MSEFAKLYRISHGFKISALRLLAYPVFGLVIGGALATPYAALDIAVLAAGIAAASFFNDYYDWKLLGEKNALAERGSSSRMPGALPLTLAIIGMLLLGALPVRTSAIAALWAACALSFFYSVPPVRLKSRRILGFFAPPVGIFLLYWQGVLLLRPITVFSAAVSLLVFLFAWYLEFLHLLDDTRHEHEVHKMSEARAMMFLKMICGIGIASGIALGSYHPLFLLSGLAWALRLHGIIRYLPDDIDRARRSVLHPIWRLEDFAAYALVGMMGILDSII